MKYLHWSGVGWYGAPQGSDQYCRIAEETATRDEAEAIAKLRWGVDEVRFCITPPPDFEIIFSASVVLPPEEKLDAVSKRTGIPVSVLQALLRDHDLTIYSVRNLTQRVVDIQHLRSVGVEE